MGKPESEATHVNRIISRRQFLQHSVELSALVTVVGLTGLAVPVRADTPVWSKIPDQRWAVGEEVYLDLTDYVADPSGDALEITLDLELPPGLRLEGGIIRGIPTGEFPTARYTATADDGKPEPLPPSGLNATDP